MRTFQISFILVIVCLLNLSTSAQITNFGFGLQTSAYKKYDINKSEDTFIMKPHLSEFHLALEYLPVKDLGIELRLGIFPIEYSAVNGFEYGITVKYYFLQEIYLVGTYTIHMNFESGGSFGAKDATFGMPGIGVGYKLIEPIRFELVFLDPKNTIIENYSEYTINPVALEWLIRLNVGFYLPL